mgnify:CR=1 FL=1
MNKAQKWVFLGFIVVVAGMLLFPPYRNGQESVGYHFVFSEHGWTINATMLAAQLIEVLIAGVIAYFAVRRDE